MIKLNENELKEQLEEIINFFHLVHQQLFDENKNKFCIEIRPILRESYDFKLSRSLNIWNLNKSNINKLSDFLKEHNGVPCCLYYSVFTFDYDKLSYTKSGQPAKKGKINSINSIFTNEIVLDFDNISYTEYTNLVNKFETINIKCSWIFTGHGYQAHIILDKPCSDKKILLKLVYKFRSKGFDVDVNCVDSARVMRLPYTFNCKCYQDIKYRDELDNPRLTGLINISTEKYSLETIIERLDRLKTVNEDAENFYKSNDNILSIKKISYPYLERFDLPIPIKNILSNTIQGYRNKSLGFLTKYFTKYLKLSKNQVYEILKIWSEEACEPEYFNFDVDFNRFYYNNGLNYDTEMTKQFGYIDFSSQISIQKQYIIISNDFLKEINSLEGKLVRLYLGIKLLEHTKKSPTIEALSKLLDISTRSIKSNLADLLETKYIYKTTCNKQERNKYEYNTSKYSSFINGYTKLSYNDVRCYLMDLNNNELKLYLFLNYKFFSNECYMSQNNIGKYIGLKQNTISGIVKNLEKNDYIEIQKTYIAKNVFYYTYILLK